MRGLFAVPMPELPKGQGEARTRARIGRKVAGLFGVPGSPGPDDTTAVGSWTASYAALTMNELLLGGPLAMKSAPTGIEDTGVFERSPAGQRGTPGRGGAHSAAVADGPISPTLVRGYGPDPKAAVVLTGANVVLRPLTEALVTVLTRMRFPDVRLLMGTTAMLLSEAMRSQPALVLAGVQAARVQRGLYLEDAVEILANDPSEAEPWRVSRLDLPWTRRMGPQPNTDPGIAGSPVPPPIREKDSCPIQLDLVSEVWAALIDSSASVRLIPRSTNQPGFEQPHDVSQIGLIRETALAAARGTTESIVFGLGNDAAGTRVVLRQQEDGGFYMDFPGVATRPARALVDRLLGAYFEVESHPVFGRRPPATTPVLIFDADAWARESPLVQRVALWAHHCAERFVVSGAWSESEPHSASFDARTEQRHALAAAAERYFGADDPLTAQLRVFHASYRLEQQRRQLVRTNAAPLSECKAVDDFEAAVHRLIELSERRRVLDSHVVESLQPNLFDLASFTEVATGELSAKLAELLAEIWGAYLDIQVRLLAPPQLVRRLSAGILTDLAGEDADRNPVLRAILESSPSLATGVAAFRRDDALSLAVRIQENTTKRRETIFDIEGDWPPLRQAMVDEARLKMVRYMRLTDPNERDKAIDDVLQITRQVVAMELAVHDAKPEAAGLIPGFPQDALLFTLAQYLLLTTTYTTLDRETGGLKQDILNVLRKYRPCVAERLQQHPWSLVDLERHRAVLLAAIRIS